MHLPTPLGAWYDVEHHINTGVARLGKHIYVTERTAVKEGSSARVACTMRFTQRARSGFFDFDDYIDAIPANAQPISCQFIDSDTVWTKKPFNKQTCTEKMIPPPGELASREAVTAHYIQTIVL